MPRLTLSLRRMTLGEPFGMLSICGHDHSYDTSTPIDICKPWHCTGVSSFDLVLHLLWRDELPSTTSIHLIIM
jgi:hypothetical protein